MILLHTLNQFKKYYHFVESLSGTNGRIYFHSPLSIEASLIQHQNKDIIVVIDTDNSIVTVFEKKSLHTWQCAFNGFPLLTKKDIHPADADRFLQSAISQLGGDTLYFPLVYKTKSVLAPFVNNPCFKIYDRLPSPIVKGSFDPEVIWHRVVSRLGSRAVRQKKLFEKQLFTESFTGVDVKENLSKIELNSWKRIYKQDMLSRDNQIDYYSQIIKSGLAKVTFAFDKNDNPVAFRIDAEINKVLFVLKWSYDDSYKRYSPGFYLLTIDLFRSVKNVSLKYIDLYGSPDNLKALIETDRLERSDIFLSENPQAVIRIANERIAYDTRINNNYRRSQSIKKLFNYG